MQIFAAPSRWAKTAPSIIHLFPSILLFSFPQLPLWHWCIVAAVRSLLCTISSSSFCLLHIHVLLVESTSIHKFITVSKSTASIVLLTVTPIMRPTRTTTCRLPIPPVARMHARTFPIPTMTSVIHSFHRSMLCCQSIGVFARLIQNGLLGLLEGCWAHSNELCQKIITLSERPSNITLP